MRCTLSDYYERKVLAAVSALIYSFGGDPKEKERAEKLADETVELYQVAADFMWEHLDNKSGQIRGGWWDEKKDVPGLVELEKKDRQEMAMLFDWASAGGDDEEGDQPAKLSTTL